MEGNVNFLVPIALWSWLPITFLFFCLLPARRAVLCSVIGGYLFLPSIVYDVEGLPDFSKDTVISIGTLLCVAIFDLPRLFAFRPKWYDVPIVCHCVISQFVSRAVNYVPLYEGMAASLEVISYFGIPYFLGRLYFSDLKGLRDLAIGFVAGGLVYVPLCLWEIRMSPQLNRGLYGFAYISGGFLADNLRWGGYRPKVFMTNGIILSTWMAGSAVMAFWLWKGKSVVKILSMRFGPLVALMVATAVLCKSTGAIALMAVGLALPFAAVRKRGLAVLLLFSLLPLLYMTSRATGLWSGMDLVEFTQTYVDPDRAASLKFRLDQENELVAKAMQKPLFGWSGARGRIFSDTGADKSVTDGFWVIIIGDTGLFGLTMFTALHCLPQLLLLKRYPVRYWSDPAVAPAAGTAVVLGLYLIDNMLNATFGQVTTLMCGGLIALAPRTSSSAGSQEQATGSEAEAEEVTGLPELAALLVESGQVVEAEAVCREAVDFYQVHAAAHAADPSALRELAAARNSLGAVLLASGDYLEAERALAEAVSLQRELTAHCPSEPVYRHELASSLHNLGNVHLATGRAVEAEGLWREALDIESNLAAEFPSEPVYRRDLAIGIDHLGRFLYEQGRFAESQDVRYAAVECWGGLSADRPGVPEYQERWADGCNDMAWSLCGGGTSGPDREAAVRLALNATALRPSYPTYWNTLGVAYYRAGDWPSSSEALERSAALNGGGTGFDLYFLAMAYARQGCAEQARHCFFQAEDWTAAHQPGHPDLVRFRDEAVGVLGLSGGGDSREESSAAATR